MLTNGGTIREQGVWYIFGTKISFPAAIKIELLDTNSDGMNDKLVIAFGVVSAPETGSVVLDVKNIGTQPISMRDIRIDNPSGLTIKLNEGATATIKPNRRKAIGYDFTAGAPGTYIFSVSL